MPSEFLEHFWIETPLGYKLNAKIDIVDSESKNIVIVCHGYLSDSTFGLCAAICNAEMFNTVRFDFHGCGVSEGEDQWSFGGYMGEVEDIKFVRDYLVNNGWNVTGLIGHSRGGDDVLLYASKYHDIPAVINIAGRYHVSSTAYENFRAQQLKLLTIQGFFEQKSICGRHTYRIDEEQIMERRRIQMGDLGVMEGVEKILTIHGTADTRIPFGDALEFCRTLDKSRHWLAVIVDGSHGLWDKPQTAHDTILAIRTFLVDDSRETLLTAEAALDQYLRKK